MGTKERPRELETERPRRDPGFSGDGESVDESVEE